MSYEVCLARQLAILSLGGRTDSFLTATITSNPVEFFTRQRDWSFFNNVLNYLSISDASRFSLRKYRKAANRRKDDLTIVSTFTRIYEQATLRNRHVTKGKDAPIRRNGPHLPDLFQMMKSSPAGDWNLRDFTSKNPDCVAWKDPDHGMVPLLYAIAIRSRWLVRHFIQLDQSKVFEKDKFGRGALEIAVETDDMGILDYISNQLGENPRDPHTSPLELEDPYADLPDGVEGLFEIHRRHKELVDRHNARKASDNVVNLEGHKPPEP